MAEAIRDGNHVTVALGVSSTSSTTTLPFTIDSATGRLLTNSASGSGDVVGPASATDNAIARFDSTTGKLIQNSAVTIADTTGVIAGTEGITLSGTTSGTTAVVATAIAGTTTLTLPAATDTLVGKATTDTLTNKTIDQDGTGNSITNIADASIKAAAAIAVNKLAALTASEIVISDGSGFISSAAVATYPSLTELTYVKGVTSAIQTQIDGKGANPMTTGGDVVYGGASGVPTRLANGTVGQVLTSGGTTAAPTWEDAGVGDMVLASVQTVTGAKTFGSAGAVGKLKIAGTTSGAIILDTSAVAGTATVTVPAVDDTLVGKATTDTLTNKTIDADGTGNSITNIENADIKAAAGIALNKLAALTASEMVISDGSGFMVSAAVATYPSLTELTYVKGVTSAIQTQLGTKAPLDSPVFTTAVTLPVALTGVIRADSGVVSVDTDVTDLVSASSLTLAGKVELATTAEIDTGTDSTRAIPVDQFVASKRNIRWLVFNLVEAATNCAVATNIGGDFVSPIAGTILQSDTTPFYLYATNSTAGTTGTMVVDISIGGTSIMTTNKLDFDTTEKTTTTAATPPDLTTTALAVGDIITIDVDAVHTTAAKGLTVYIAIRE